MCHYRRGQPPWENLSCWLFHWLRCQLFRPPLRTRCFSRRPSSQARAPAIFRIGDAFLRCSRDSPPHTVVGALRSLGTALILGGLAQLMCPPATSASSSIAVLAAPISNAMVALATVARQSHWKQRQQHINRIPGQRGRDGVSSPQLARSALEQKDGYR
jgi:hypothetical protein